MTTTTSMQPRGRRDRTRTTTSLSSLARVAAGTALAVAILAGGAQAQTPGTELSAGTPSTIRLDGGANTTLILDVDQSGLYTLRTFDLGTDVDTVIDVPSLSISDDDSGPGLASRLDLALSADEALPVVLRNIGGGGAFTIALEPIDGEVRVISPAQLGTIAVDETVLVDSIDAAEVVSFGITVPDAGEYIFETFALAGPDTLLVVPEQGTKNDDVDGSRRSRVSFVTKGNGPVELRLFNIGEEGRFAARLWRGDVAEILDTDGDAVSRLRVDTDYDVRLGRGLETQATFRVPRRGLYVIETFELEGGADSVIALPELGLQDDDGSEDEFLASRLSVIAEPVETYALTVRNIGDSGRFGLRIAPETDLDAELVNAQELGTDPLQVQTDTAYLVASVTPETSTTVRFQAPQTSRYELVTSDLSGVDTIVSLPSAGLRDDDGGEGLGSRLRFNTQAGETYEFIVDNIGGRGHYRMTVREAPMGAIRPAGAGEGPGVSALALDTAYSVRLEQGGDAVATLQAGETGIYVIETFDLENGVDTVLTVPQTNLWDDDGGDGLASRLELILTADEAVQVAVENIGDAGQFGLRVRRSGASLDQTIVLSETPAVTLMAGQRYLMDGFVPQASHSLTFTPPADGTYVIETSALQGSDTLLDIPALGLSDDDGGDGLGSRLSFRAQADQPVEIIVRNIGSEGRFILTLTQQ